MKRVLIFGATGACGSDAVDKALRNGWQVTAFARSPDKVTQRHPQLTVMQGDILDPASIDRALATKPDAVICAVGMGLHRRPSTDLSSGTKTILDAMQRHGVRRFVGISSLGVGDSRVGSLSGRIFQRLALKEPIADKERQEAFVRASDLDWTMVRPSRIDRKPALKRFETWQGMEPPRSLSWVTTKEDVADFVVDTIEHESYVRQAINMSN